MEMLPQGSVAEDEAGNYFRIDGEQPIPIPAGALAQDDAGNYFLGSSEQDALTQHTSSLAAPAITADNNPSDPNPEGPAYDVRRDRTAIQDFGKWSDPYEDQMRVMALEHIDNPNVQRRADLAGVGTEGSSVGVRTAASFGNEEGIQKALENKYGEGTEVRTGPDTGEMEFKPPETDKWELVNQPGVDMGDVTGLAGDALVAASDVVGSVFGGSVGGAMGISMGNPVTAGVGIGTGTTLGSGISTFGGEVARQSIGNLMGVNDAKMEDMIKDAAVKSGIAMTVTGGVFGLAKFSSWVIAKLKGKHFDGSPSDFGLDDKTANQIVDDINQGLKEGNQFKPRPGQMGNQELLHIDEAFAHNTGLYHTKKFREVQEGNLDSLKEFFDNLNSGTSGQGDNMLNSVQQAQSSVGRRVDKATGNIARQEEAMAAKSEAMYSDIVEYAPDSGGLILRGIAEQEKQAIKDTFSPKYAKFSDMGEGGYGHLKSKIDKLSILAKSIRGDADSAIFPQLEGEAQSIVKTIKSGEPVTLKQLQHAIKRVNSLLKISKKGLSSEVPDVATLERIKGALKQERKDLLIKNGREDLYDEISSMDVAYSEAKKYIDNTILGRILRVNNGKLGLIDENIGTQIFRDIESGRTMFLATQGNYEARKVLKEALFDTYKRAVFTVKPDGRMIPNHPAHMRFMNNPAHKSNINLFFDGAERAQIRNIGGFSALMVRQAKQIAKRKAKIKKSFGSQVANGEPEALMSMVFSNKMAGTTEALVSMLKRDPAALDAFQYATKERLSGILVKSGRLDMAQFNKIFDSAQTMQNIEAVLGKGYAKDLGTLRDALNLVTKKSGLSGGAVEEPGAGILTNLIRAIWAPPLSVRGRVFSAAKSGRQDKLIDLVGEAMLDEKKLRKLMGLDKMNVSHRQKLAILSGLGALELAPDWLIAIRRNTIQDKINAGKAENFLSAFSN